MTNAELYQVLSTTGLEAFYGASRTNATTPYIVYRVAFSDNVFLDNEVKGKDFMQVELYTSVKDEEAEAKVENALMCANLPWNKTEVYDDGQSVFQIVYEFTVIR